MRSVPLLGGAMWLAFVGAASAQTTYTAVVSCNDAEVRAGPNDNPQLYVTNRLKRGSAVQVVEELGNGWLKIRPPAGSFSWISANAVQHVVPNQPNWMVVGPADVRVAVIVGTDFKKDVPSQIEGSRLSRGAQVISIGPARVDEQGAWLPIESPPGEFRYLRADVVTRSDGSPIVRTGGLPAAAPGSMLAAKPVVSTPLPSMTDCETFWKQATDAERAGNIPTAIDLYDRAAASGQGIHPELVQQARDRASWLSARASVPAHSTFTSTAVPSADFRLTSSPAAPPNVQLAGPVGVYTTATRPQAPTVATTGPGRLRRAGRFVEGRTTYVLESYQGRLLYYVTAEPGVNLEPFINQNVEMFGPAGYNGELRANYMRVEHVQMAR